MSERSVPSLRDLRRLTREEFAGFGRQGVGVGLLGGLSATLEVGIVLVVASLGTAVISGESDQPIELALGLEMSRTGLAVVALGLVVLRGLAELLHLWKQSNALMAYEQRARVDLMDAFVDAEWQAQSSMEPARFVNTGYSFLLTSRTAYRHLMQVVTSLVSFVVMVAASVLAGGAWAFGIVVGSLILALAFRPLAGVANRAATAARDAAHRFGDSMWETVLLAREIRVLGVSDQVKERNRQRADAVAHAHRRQNLASGLLSSSYTTMLYLVVSLGLLVVAVVDVDDPSAFVAILMLLYRGLGYGRTFQSSYQELVASEPAMSFLRDTSIQLREARIPVGGARLEGPVQEVELRDVGLTYPDGSVALTGVDLRLQAGETLGIVGPSGAGKTTLVQLLLRLIVPTEGTITVDGLDLASIDTAEWFGRAVLIAQDARTLDGDVMDNVVAFRSGIDEAQVRQALRDAHLLDEVEALPKGLHTVLDANRLSGGQRQRLAIARALVGRPDLLVLDEPTSALDLPSEEAIRETLETLRGRVTLVIVAHRLSTLRICDRVLVLDGGRIDAIGDRDELEEGSAFYAEALRLARLV